MFGHDVSGFFPKLVIRGHDKEARDPPHGYVAVSKDGPIRKNNRFARHKSGHFK